MKFVITIISIITAVVGLTAMRRTRPGRSSEATPAPVQNELHALAIRVFGDIPVHPNEDCEGWTAAAASALTKWRGLNARFH